MGLADRDYIRNEPTRAPGSRLTPVVKWLLVLNLGIFAFDYLILGSMQGGGHGVPPIVQWGAFSIQSAVLELHVWKFLTFQFLHGSLGHVGFNCIAIYFFGPWMERWAGSRRFLLFYLLCGCGGAALFTLLALLKVVPGGVHSDLVGASAGIYGILIGVAMIAPGLRVTLLFPPVTLTMRQLALALLAFAVVMIALQIGGNEGGEAGHLGGALVGFALMRLPLFRRNAQPWRDSSGSPPARASKWAPRSGLALHDDPEVDAILDKISERGFQSLTDQEREILTRASQRHNDSRP